ncbi:hypothetical protein ACWGRF_28855 [Streptomyces zhihengii]
MAVDAAGTGTAGAAGVAEGTAAVAGAEVAGGAAAVCTGVMTKLIRARRS